jgi:hypothetical protein
LDVSVRLYGIDVTLFVPSNWDDVDQNTMYHVPAQEFTFTEYVTRAFIEWSPSIHRLKNFGIVTEGELPILCYMEFPKDLGSFESYPDTIIGSWIRVPLQYVQRYRDTDEFEIVDNFVRGMHDAVAVSCLKLAPRREKRDVVGP